MNKRSMVNGWFFIPSTMVFCALTWGTATNIPAIMLKSMDVPNSVIGLTSMLGLPIAFRFIFGPFVDAHGTKRKWTLTMQTVICGAMLFLSGLCGLSILMDFGASPVFLVFLVTLFACLAFISSFNDISWGGFFLMSVDERDKALFVGVNSAFVRIANIFSQGFMVILAGRIQQKTGLVMSGWAVCFAVFGIIQFILMIYHRFAYPFPVLDKPLVGQQKKSFREVFRLFMKQRRAVVILGFVFLYRIDQGLLNFMKVPFLMDSPEAGGLGLPLEQIGTINGIYAVIGMILGGLLGGLMIRRFGLRKMIWPFAFLLTIPNAGFVWLAIRPAYQTIFLMGVEVNLWALIATVFEAFGYGMGFSSFSFFHCEVSRGPYRATFFALMTGVMTISWILSGSLSGIIQAQIGYFQLFVLSMVVSIPGIAIIAWLPLEELEEKGKIEDAERHAVNNK